MSFLNSIQEAVATFEKEDLSTPIHIISNKDTDGITAAAILVKAFRRKNIPCTVTLLKQLTEDYLATLHNEQYSIYFFLDMGANFLHHICEQLSSKHIFILDHHYPDTFPSTQTKLVHLNPHLHDIDGAQHISAAGIAYLFAKTLDENNKQLAHLALIGALGDMQEHHGFEGPNKDILQDAIDTQQITVKTDLRLFGIHTKPVHKFIQYMTNPYLPYVTGSESGAITFLNNNGIRPKLGNKFKWITEFTKEDIEKLLVAVYHHQPTPPTAAQFTGPVYFLPQESKHSPTHDATEFSTLLNACGKMGNPSLGIAVCLGDQRAKEQATILLQQYHHNIISCLTWFANNKQTQHIIEDDHFVIINAESSIKDSLIGTLTSMLANNDAYAPGTVIIGLAHLLSDEIKISARIAGPIESSQDLRKLLKSIIKKTGGQAGGHKMAAGAIIPADKLQLFLKTCKEQLHESLTPASPAA